MRRKSVRTLLLSAVLAILLLVATASSALAYGNTEQWQIGFSVTCNNSSLCPPASGIFQSPGPFGFWGWCAFGGSNGSAAVGTTGSTADCQFSFYTRPPANDVFHLSYDVTGWKIESGSALLPPGVPGFFVTSGTYTVQGPGAAILGIPTGVPIPFPSPCPAVLCDTGLPAVPGHVDLHPFPGYEINVQVTQLP
ncbi:MAG TPA: hypothetical protein VGR57_11035 [Ktedonobacterales bacterium]|nr:hypothetical protein [Ktedonobacterales bacterium]